MEEKDLKELFGEEILTISEDLVRDFGLYLFYKAPDYFWTRPSSSTGKYHPKDEHSVGGLVLHSIRVKKAADILLSATPPPIHVSAVKLGALFHDIGRYGFRKESEPFSVKDHAELGYSWVRGLLLTFPGDSELLRKTVDTASKTILAHMGRWGNVHPKTREEWIVHYADMIASQYTP